MTTTPIGPPPVAVADPTAPGAADSSDGSTGGDVFLTLVQALLGAGTVPQSPRALAPVVADGAPTGTADEDPATVDATAAEPVGPPDPALAPGVVPALVAGPVTPSPGANPVAIPIVNPVASPVVTRAATTTAGSSAAPAGEASDAVVGVAGAGAPVLPSAVPAGTAGTGSQPARATATPQQATPAADASIASTTATGPQPDRATSEATAATGASTDALPSSSPTSSPSSSPTSSPTVPVGATAAPATSVAAPATTATNPATNPVTHQVFPEVVRLTTSSDGPQRITIRMNPESLGEVRVVLTQRQGRLEVSLSAGTEARRALAAGTPELQRLLDAVGRSDARIVVRDGTGLPVASSMPSAGTSGQTGAQQPGAGAQWSTDLSGGAWSGARHGGGEATAGHGRSTMPGSSNATDGIPDATAPSRRTATITGARSGLDVTM